MLLPFLRFSLSFAEEHSYLSLSSAATLFISLVLKALKFFLLFDRVKSQCQAWWSPKVEEAVSKRRKTFAAAHRINEDRQTYIYASPHTSFVIAKTEAEGWQETCSSFSPKSDPKCVYFHLCSVVRSSSLSASSPNFLKWSSNRELASVFAHYLRSHFSVSQPKILRSRAKGYLTQAR